MMLRARMPCKKTLRFMTLSKGSNPQPTSSHLSTGGLSGAAAVAGLAAVSVVLVKRIMSISSVSSGMVERMNTTVDTTTTPIEVNAYNCDNVNCMRIAYNCLC